MLETAVPAVFSYLQRQWKYHTSLHLLLSLSSSWNIFPAQIVTEPENHTHAWKTLLANWNLSEFRKQQLFSLFRSFYAGMGRSLDPFQQTALQFWIHSRTHKHPQSVCTPAWPQTFDYSCYSPCYSYSCNSNYSCNIPLRCSLIFLLFSHHTFPRNVLCFERWQ